MAGADAILMHSKRSDANEIEAFVKAWDNKVSYNHLLDILVLGISQYGSASLTQHMFEI